MNTGASTSPPSTSGATPAPHKASTRSEPDQPSLETSRTQPLLTRLRWGSSFHTRGVAESYLSTRKGGRHGTQNGDPGIVADRSCTSFAGVTLGGVGLNRPIGYRYRDYAVCQRPPRQGGSGGDLHQHGREQRPGRDHRLARCSP